MKKIKPITLVIALLAVLIVGTLTYLAVDLLGRNDPDRYVTLGQYQNLVATVDVDEPNEKDLQDFINLKLEAFAKQIPVNDGAANGDHVTFSFTSSLNGQALTDLSSNETTVVLGENEFVISGLDTHLLGVKAGDTLTAPLTVPEGHVLKDYAGKTIDFSVTVTKVTRLQIPQLTEQWVKEQTAYDSVDAFTAVAKAEYEQEVADFNKATVRNTLWNMVVEDSQIKSYPAKRLSRMQKEYKADLQEGADKYEMEFIDYVSLSFGVATMEEFEEYSLTYNQEILKQELVIEALCKKEKITLSDQEYEQYVSDYTALFAVEGFTQEDMIDHYGGEDTLRLQFLMEKCTDRIEETATVTTE